MENASDDFPQQKKLENLFPNFAGSSTPISPKTSPTSLWKSLVLKISVCISSSASWSWSGTSLYSIFTKHALAMQVAGKQGLLKKSCVAAKVEEAAAGIVVYEQIA